MSVVGAGPARAGAPYTQAAEKESSRARGIVLYLEDGGQLGPCITERLALAQRDVGLLVAPVIAARSAGEDETGATPDILAHRDRLADALIETADHVTATVAGRGLPLVVIAEGVAAAAALRAAARRPTYFAALVLVDGRVDLADSALAAVRAPVLLLTDGLQPALVAVNRLALVQLQASTRLIVLSPCENARAGMSDLCGTALSVMRGWLSTLPALSSRPAPRWTPRESLRAAAAKLRQAVAAPTGKASSGDGSRHLRPAI